MKISKKDIVKTEFEFSSEHEALLRKNIEDAKIALNDYRWLLLDYLRDRYSLTELARSTKVDKAMLSKVHNKKKLMSDNMYTVLINFINERKVYMILMKFSLDHEVLLRKNIEDAKVALNDYRWLLLDYLRDVYSLRELARLTKVDKALLSRLHNKKQLISDNMYALLINFINERKV